MNNKDKGKTKDEIEEIKSNSEDQNDDSSTIREILLDLEEDPNTIIEKILIKIFNQIIMNKNDIEEGFISFYKIKIKELCIKHLKKNIILLLFVNIRNIIQKYRLKLFQNPNIVELRKNYYEKFNNNISYILDEKYSKSYLNFAIDRGLSSYPGSPERIRHVDYYLVIKNLLNKLRGIKNCLNKASPIIEKIFEYPLSDFETFSIIECAKEEYLKILIHDNFIWSEIVKNKNTLFHDIIQEILDGLDGDSFHVNIIDNKIEYFTNFRKKSLKISKIQSSIDTRKPEEAKPIIDIQFKFGTNFNNYFDNYEEDDKISDDDDSDLDIDNNNNIRHGFANINMIKLKEKNLNFNKLAKIIDIKKGIITNETINEMNIFGEKLKKFSFSNNNTNNNTTSVKVNFNKNNSISIEDNNININSNISNKKKSLNNKNIENNTSSTNSNKNSKKNKNKKTENNNKNIINIKSNEEKKEIPNNLDDLVKYIKDDSTGEKQGKKKKKNRKKAKKKNKNNNEDKKEEKEINEIKDSNNIIDEDKELQALKDDLVKDSINRYKIHKIKFKYRPYFIKKLEKMNP